MCESSEACKEEMPNLLCCCTQEERKGDGKAFAEILDCQVQSGWAEGVPVSPQGVWEEGKAVLCSNTLLSSSSDPLSDKGHRDC